MINLKFQCAMPVFDGLLPEPHNKKVQQLLFVLAHWHSLAKLRIHTDQTLDIMDSVTSDLGRKLRTFKQNTCAAFETRELRRESDARIRKQNRNSRPSVKHTAVRANQPDPVPPSIPPSITTCTTVPASSSAAQSTATNPESASPASKSGSHDRSARRPKDLNLNTYKFHALGDYAATIRRYGTTDSYSTEPVSETLSH